MADISRNVKDMDAAINQLANIFDDGVARSFINQSICDAITRAIKEWKCHLQPDINDTIAEFANCVVEKEEATLGLANTLADALAKLE